MSRVRFMRAPSKPVDLLARNPIFKAMGRAPMAPHKQLDLALAARLAFESIQRGRASEADRDTLACMVNVVMVLAEKHCSQVELDAALLAQRALLRGDGRVLEGARWNFDGEGRRALLDILDIHEQQIAALGQTAITEALLEIRARMDRGQVHQVVLEEATR